MGGMCLILAWVILCLATTNWIMATLSLLCIVAILIVFAGCLPLFGFSLGIFESVGLIVVLGLSVDYTVHIAHSLFLLPSKFMFYHVFGIFMLTTVVVSTLISLTLLPALLMLFGPAGSAGNIVWIQRATDWVASRIGQCCRKRAAVSDSEQKV